MSCETGSSSSLNGSSSVTFFTVAPQQSQKSNAQQKSLKVESPVKNRAIQPKLFVAAWPGNKEWLSRHSWELASAAAERSSFCSPRSVRHLSFPRRARIPRIALPRSTVGVRCAGVRLSLTRTAWYSPAPHCPDHGTSARLPTLRNFPTTFHINPALSRLNRPGY